MIVVFHRLIAVIKKGYLYLATYKRMYKSTVIERMELMNITTSKDGSLINKTDT